MKKLSASILVALAVAASVSTAAAGWTYKLSAYAPSAKVSTGGVASVTIEAAADYTIDAEQSFQISVIAPDGIVLERVMRAPKDGVEPRKASTELEIAFTATKKGRHEMTARVDFSVCAKGACELKTDTISFDINVR